MKPASHELLGAASIGRLNRTPRQREMRTCGELRVSCGSAGRHLRSCRRGRLPPSRVSPLHSRSGSCAGPALSPPRDRSLPEGQRRPHRRFDPPRWVAAASMPSVEAVSRPGTRPCRWVGCGSSVRRQAVRVVRNRSGRSASRSRFPTMPGLARRESRRGSTRGEARPR
jgi:hypothetical protein